MAAASISGSVTSFVGDQGVYAVFLLMAIGAVFPAASELVMIYAGALASGAFVAQHVVVFGHEIGSRPWAFVTMALAGTAGYLVGALAGWSIGRYGGRPFVERHARFLHLGHGRLQRAERWFDRHDRWAVLVGCVTPVVRSFVAIPAGLFRMSVARYALLVLPGAAAFAFAFAALGWAFGRNYERFQHALDLALAAGLALVALYLVVRVGSSRLKPRA